MTSTELQDFLNAERANDRKARTLANIARRAETLFTTDGYTVTEPVFDIYIVRKPETVNELGWNENGTSYTVSLRKDFHNCTCPCFKDHGTCKHYLAVKADADAQEAALEAQAEHAALVADYYTEYAAANW